MMPPREMTEGSIVQAARLVRILFGLLALAATDVLAQSQAAAPQAAQVSTQGDRQRLQAALASLRPQRPGVVDAYVIVAALDTAPVFGREAREAGRVLEARFDAAGRTLVLAEDEGSDKAGAPASPEYLGLAIRRATQLMDGNEDVLVLYTTSHGSPQAGLNFRDPARGASVIAPAELAAMLDQPGIKNRLIILQACFAGQFVPALATPRTVVATAASSMHSSFGCSAGTDWTFFGYALINQAMRQPDTFVRQFRRAFVSILGWENRLGIDPSNPQISVGSDTAKWLAALDSHAASVPRAPVGRAPPELSR